MASAHFPPLLVPLSDLPKYGIHFSSAGLGRAIRHGFPKPIAIVEGGNKLAFLYSDLVAYCEMRKLHAEEDAAARRVVGAKILEARRKNPEYLAFRKRSAEKRASTKKARAAAEKARRQEPVEAADELAALTEKLGMLQS
ncbi:MAG: hypothetical protein ACLQME_13695 [Alphaproteobacteria bacterium]